MAQFDTDTQRLVLEATQPLHATFRTLAGEVARQVSIRNAQASVPHTTA
jgi:hypothetical protein